MLDQAENYFRYLCRKTREDSDDFTTSTEQQFSAGLVSTNSRIEVRATHGLLSCKPVFRARECQKTLTPKTSESSDSAETGLVEAASRNRHHNLNFTTTPSGCSPEIECPRNAAVPIYWSDTRRTKKGSPDQHCFDGSVSHSQKCGGTKLLTEITKVSKGILI